jgi:poly-gamma-glutamate biosynthesis protein PgsC/CapC
MADISILAVGIGIVINLVFFEVFGLAAGGMVVPGYMALSISDAASVITTLLASIFVFLILRFLSNFMLIYGRRHLVLSIMLGFIFGQTINILSSVNVFTLPYEVRIIGYIVPGLIAYWMERQGIVRTIATLLTGSILTRFFLILVMGGRL